VTARVDVRGRLAYRAATRSAPSHRVRIIGGQWKRTPLDVVDAPGLRPTPDRVRETLFNWLGQQLDGLICLDLFAGSGALGLEAASRGAREVTLVERRSEPCRLIERLCLRLEARSVKVLEMDAQRALVQFVREGRRFDLVFLDPPFGERWIERLWPSLTRVLAPAARVYVEAEAALSGPPAGFAIERSARAGQVHYHLLSWLGPEGDARGPNIQEER
jgi:16S rRNA (guanine966-N2)-methyltransferase